MLSYSGMHNGLYRIYDSDDGTVDEVTYEELLYSVRDLGLDIKGALFAKRTGTLLIEQIRGNWSTKSPTYFAEEVFNLVGDEYTVLEKYVRSRVKILFRHNVCGHKYLQEPRNFLAGKRCPKCFRLVKETTESFKKLMKDAVGDDYSLLSEYVGANDGLTIRHNVCGKVFNMVAANFKRGQRCPYCTKSGIPVRSFEEMACKVSSITSNYELLSYEGCVVPATFKHLVCGNIFKMKTYTFLELNGRCPFCKISVPERLLQLELQKWFDCKFNYFPSWLRGSSGYKLELDIFMPSIKTAVEYDGGNFHIDRINTDEDKDNCCYNNGIKLIRLRDFGLPALNSPSVQICASVPITLRRNRGIDDFERMVTRLLSELGLTHRYVVDRAVLADLYEKSEIRGAEQEG